MCWYFYDIFHFILIYYYFLYTVIMLIIIINGCESQLLFIIIGDIDTVLLSMNIINLLINCYYNIFILVDMYLFGRKSIIRWRNFGKAKYFINSCHFITYFIELFRILSQFSLVYRIYIFFL